MSPESAATVVAKQIRRRCRSKRRSLGEKIGHGERGEGTKPVSALPESYSRPFFVDVAARRVLLWVVVYPLVCLHGKTVETRTEDKNESRWAEWNEK